MAVDTVLSRPQLPDHIIHQIIQLLPTKSAVRMSSLSKQFEAAWYTQPVLDFDEGKPRDDTTDSNLQHIKFINILDRYLDYFRNDEKIKQQLLDKFRLRITTNFSVSESTMVDELLSLAVRRSVKELDISIGGKHAALYCLTPKKPLNLAKSITTLSLEHVTINEDESNPHLSFPSLKTMSLKTLRFSHSLISRCPSLETLSVSTSSMCDGSSTFVVSNSNLKSLDITNCDFFQLEVRTTNLESFTFVSEDYIRLISLSKCRNLKSLNILAQKLHYLYISGCGHSVKATIDSSSLEYVQFTGFLKYKLSIKALNLSRARITLCHEEQSFNEPWEHFSSLRDFLESFASCYQEIILRVDHAEMAQALIFPENFRKTVSPPLPILKHFRVRITSPMLARNSDLMDSLTWIAPSAEIQRI
ncbi:F-box protein At4g09920-like [Rosa rugosa]|uniref:F-box protein At4g09920-like n=1 Tax=Rosa rugosa TaxID=74645 RepID=UPI002B4027AF|nr:F-box protein At4g09920-like [Rosa rugosa]